MRPPDIHHHPADELLLSLAAGTLPTGIRLVTEIHLSKRVDRQHPRMEIRLQTLPDAILQEGVRHTLNLQPSPVTTKRRRRRKRQRSLEELAIRHNWE